MTIDNETILKVAREVWPTPAILPMDDVIAFARKIAAMQRKIDAHLVEDGVFGHGECANLIRRQGK